MLRFRGGKSFLRAPSDQKCNLPLEDFSLQVRDETSGASPPDFFEALGEFPGQNDGACDGVLLLQRIAFVGLGRDMNNFAEHRRRFFAVDDPDYEHAD